MADMFVFTQLPKSFHHLGDEGIDTKPGMISTQLTYAFSEF